MRASDRRARPTLAAALAAACLASGEGVASPPPLSAPITSQDGADGPPSQSGFPGDLQRTNFLLGDMFGLRGLLSRYGLSFALQETSEVLANPAGGAHRGAAYDGLTQAILQLDTQRAFGWYGGLFNVSALQIHGRDFSADDLLSLQTSSGIAGDRATRLWELWYDQKFLEEDRLDVKIGQQSVDQEFIVNPNGAYFLNTMFGWPVVPSYDLPGGGPAYPLSAPGIRLRWRPVNPLTMLVGAYSGSPALGNDGDAQVSNPSGVTFPVNQGPLVFMELQYAYPALGGLVYPGEGAPLGHTYKIGAWYDAENFPDQRLDLAGGSLASADSSGIPRQHYGNWSLYAVADRMVWRQASSPNRSVSVFGRVMGTPQGDRNLVDFSFNGGAVYHFPFQGRPDDTLGAGIGYAHVSSRAAALDRDAAALNLLSSPSLYAPIRSGETFVELVYEYQARPWLQLQPDAQYIFNPGGGAANPAAPTRKIGDELVLGLRTNILF